MACYHQNNSTPYKVEEITPSISSKYVESHNSIILAILISMSSTFKPTNQRDYSLQLVIYMQT